LKNLVKWTARLDDGVSREVRVTITKGGLRWQAKRSDEEKWSYDIAPSEEDWDALEDFLRRRAGRGRSVEDQAIVHRFRTRAES
jgi:hypothetical protein